MASNELIITNKARQDIYEILYYIEHELLNPKASIDFSKELIEKMQFITDFPKAHPIIDNEYVRANDVRKINIKNYLLFYKYDFDNKQVIVLSVVYGKRDIKNTIQLL